MAEYLFISECYFLFCMNNNAKFSLNYFICISPLSTKYLLALNRASSPSPSVLLPMVIQFLGYISVAPLSYLVNQNVMLSRPTYSTN